MKLNYGSILKITGITSSDLQEVDTVMLIDDSLGGTGYDCKILDLTNYKVIGDFKDINDLINREGITIVEVVK